MAFDIRRTDEMQMIKIVQTEIFAPLSSQLKLVGPLGYETRVDAGTRVLLRFVRNPTTFYVKFYPDFLAVPIKAPERLYLLEFKSSRTPIIKDSRIRFLRDSVQDQTLERSFIGQIETLPLENYLKIASSGVRLALLYYCAYSESKLFCEFVDRIKVVHSDVVRTDTVRGSRTPFTNFDLRTMRILSTFMEQEVSGISVQEIRDLVAKAVVTLSKDLPQREERG